MWSRTICRIWSASHYGANLNERAKSRRLARARRAGAWCRRHDERQVPEPTLIPLRQNLSSRMHRSALVRRRPTVRVDLDQCADAKLVILQVRHIREGAQNAGDKA